MAQGDRKEEGAWKTGKMKGKKRTLNMASQHLHQRILSVIRCYTEVGGRRKEERSEGGSSWRRLERNGS